MEFRQQQNRPGHRTGSTNPVASRAASPAQQPSPVPAEAPPTPAPVVTQGPRSSGTKRFLLLTIVSLLSIGVGYGISAYTASALPGEYGRVDQAKYQAVFLTNDQVYFGKITSISDNSLVMEDIYYLQQGADQATDAEQPAANPAVASPMSLAKLGNELHAPEDAIQVNRDQVLYWENLRADGKVTEAIRAYRQ